MQKEFHPNFACGVVLGLVSAGRVEALALAHASKDGFSSAPTGEGFLCNSKGATFALEQQRNITSTSFQRCDRGCVPPAFDLHEILFSVHVVQFFCNDSHIGFVEWRCHMRIPPEFVLYLINISSCLVD